MNLKNISDSELHDGNILVGKEERGVLVRALHRLLETERRRLYSKYKCGSLFDYAVRYFKYSNDQADRRIKAMRVLREAPEIEGKIRSGALSLTNLALAQVLFMQEKKAGHEYSVEEKREVLSQLEDKTTREAEKIVFGIRPEMKPKSSDLNFDDIEDEVLRKKLLQAKGLYAHTHPHMNLNELLHKLCDDKIAEKTKHPSRAPKMDSEAEITRQVWRRDESKCVNCGSTHAVQVEHRNPKAVGGEYTLENLCLLCRSCNQRSAIEYYGIEKMSSYLREPRGHYSSA